VIRSAAILVLCAAAIPAHAEETQWVALGGGAFGDPANWSPGVPGATDTAVFNTGAAYTVWLSEPATISQMLVRNDTVTFDLGQNDLEIAELSIGVLLAPEEGDSAHYALTSGTMHVGGFRMSPLAGTFATALVTGADTTLFCETEVVVGWFDEGELAIENGAVVSTGMGFSGKMVGSTGLVTIDGPGSAWEIVGLLVAGRVGGSNIVVSNGGRLTCGFACVADEVISSLPSLITITGPGSVWEVTDELIAGNASTAIITIENGALLDAAKASVGRMPAGFGLITVTGPASRFTSQGDVYVGIDPESDGGGTGIIEALDGGVVTAPLITLADGATLRGDSTIAANVLSEAGWISPGPQGQTTAELHIDGDITITGSGARTIIHVDADAHDVLSVTGSAVLGGLLEVFLITGQAELAAGDRMTVLTGENVTGTYDSLSLPTLSDGLVLRVEYAPEAVELVVACLADLDGSGSLGIFDFIEMQILFQAGDPAADLNDDGELTFEDFIAFQTAFASGCGGQ